MKKEELWTLLLKRNRHFWDEPVVFTTQKQLRKFFDLVWDTSAKDMKGSGDLFKELFR